MKTKIRKRFLIVIVLIVIFMSCPSNSVFATGTADDYITEILETDASHPAAYFRGASTSYRCLNQFCGVSAVNGTLVTSAPYSAQIGGPMNPTQSWGDVKVTANGYDVYGIIPLSNTSLSINCRRILGSYVNLIYMIHPSNINNAYPDLSLNNNVGDVDIVYNLTGHYIRAAGRLGWATRYIYEMDEATGYGGYYLGWSTSSYSWYKYDISYNEF